MRVTLRGRLVAGAVVILLSAASCDVFGGDDASPPPKTSASGGVPSTSHDETSQDEQPESGTAGPVGLSVAEENARPGVDGWEIPSRDVASDAELSAYADRTSIRAGESFRLLVSTPAETVRVRALRMGWYDGTLAREVWASEPVPGGQQPDAEVDPELRSVAVSWEPSLTVPTDGWPEGMYLLRLDTSDERARYVPLVVRSTDTRDRLVLMHATYTWQAYNEWGDHSLYRGGDGSRDSRSYAVSFDRPWDDNGASTYLYMEDALVHRAERQGLPLAYLTNLELDREPDVLDGARGLVSMGHDEYWSADMKRHAEQARDRGTNLAFLGANGVYWRVRYDAERRLLIGYKSAALDPEDDERSTTARFRDAPAADRETSLIGQMYECYPALGAFTVHDPAFFLFAGTGAERGSRFEGLIGIEVDRAYPGPATPRPLQVVARSPITCRGADTVSTAVYYTAPSGAGVFSTGTMRWVRALKGPVPSRGLDEEASDFARQVTDNLLREMLEGPMGHRHPAADNLDEMDLPDRNMTGAA